MVRVTTNEGIGALNDPGWKLYTDSTAAGKTLQVADEPKRNNEIERS